MRFKTRVQLMGSPQAQRRRRPEVSAHPRLNSLFPSSSLQSFAQYFRVTDDFQIYVPIHKTFFTHPRPTLQTPVTNSCSLWLLTAKCLDVLLRRHRSYWPQPCTQFHLLLTKNKQKYVCDRKALHTQGRTECRSLTQSLIPRLCMATSGSDNSPDLGLSISHKNNSSFTQCLLVVWHVKKAKPSNVQT